MAHSIEDYRCGDCGTLVLYAMDHTPTCPNHPRQKRDRYFPGERGEHPIPVSQPEATNN